MAHLSILPPEQCKWDGVALGEVMIRFDPGDVPFERARACRIWHGGGEVNVAEGLACCFGLRTTVLTALVDDGFGRNISNQFREAGVDTSRILWFSTSGKGKYATDKKGTLMNGINATFRGKGVIPSKTEYYRAHTPVREVGAAEYDLDALFGREGVRWAHTGGIYTLLSPKTAETAIEYLKQAGQHGTLRSTDLNYRANVEPNKDRARSINRQIVPHVEFLVGNQSDFDDALGYTADVAKNADMEEWLAAYVALLRRVAKDFPNLKLIGTQLRGALSADRIDWGAVLYDVAEDKLYQATVRRNVEISDRTGGGDSFASGVIAAILKGKGLDEAVEWGAAHGVLVQETPGDTSMVTQAMVEAEVARARKGGGVVALR
ncbi:MAG: sugar kinase [candidate division NC10 bacterium]|nr:sugar kinase [candidate division NC10 bacterium]